VYCKIIYIADTSITRLNKTKHIGSLAKEQQLCTNHSVVCPKARVTIHIGVGVYTEPNRLVINEQQFRISNPMFRILCTLNENKGTILSRDFLLAYGWGASNLTKNNVTVAISELRVLLSRSSDVKIITVQRQGYLMIKKNGDKQK
jgi:DNA-binding winged helix-turn-helix (wHTH) protein